MSYASFTASKSVDLQEKDLAGHGPAEHFTNPYFFRLVKATYYYLEGSCELDRVLDEYQVLREWTEDFLTRDLPSLRASIAEKLSLGLRDPWDPAISYNLGRGVEAVQKGFDVMEQFLDSERELLLRQAIVQLQQGYDHFGHAARLHSERLTMLRAELAARRRGTTLIDEHRKEQSR